MTFIESSQDSWTGWWDYSPDGSLNLYSEKPEEGTYNPPSYMMKLINSYMLESVENRPGADGSEIESEYFYSDEYYEKNSADPDSKKASMIELSSVGETDLYNTWVTREEGPMGEWLGFTFTPYEFRFGRSSVNDPFGFWNDSEYVSRGIWAYHPEDHEILILWDNPEQGNADSLKIVISGFYNGAFEGFFTGSSMLIEKYIDYGGTNERTFWKSEGGK
jgi:hypothetical protein